MRTVILAAYLLMAVWLIVAAGVRVLLLVHGGYPLDPLPFVSGALGVVALLVYLRERRPNERRVDRQ